MSPERAGMIVCCFLLVICIVATIVQHEERKARRKLPEPRPDDRNWQGIFMKDVK